jgi:hypothetical protein
MHFFIILCMAFFASSTRAATNLNNFKLDSLAEANFQKVVPVVNTNLQENSNSTLCSNPVRGQCSFYEDCLETHYHCGVDGYPLGYGKKYCNKFNAARDKFSQNGQIWMLDTMECLQRVLVPEATGPEETGKQGRLPCDELRKKAFDSHAECYVENGVCTLSVRDWKEIVEVVDLKTLFGSWEASKEVLEAAAGCLELYAFLLLSLT